MTKVSVSVSDDYMDRFGDVADAARGAGLDVEHELKVLGVLSGSIHPSQVKALEQVPGIKSVEEDHTYQLEPPESGIQSVAGSGTGAEGGGGDIASASAVAPTDSSAVWDEDSDVEASGGSRTVDWSARSEPDKGR